MAKAFYINNLYINNEDDIISIYDNSFIKYESSSYIFTKQWFPKERMYFRALSLSRYRKDQSGKLYSADDWNSFDKKTKEDLRKTTSIVEIPCFKYHEIKRLCYEYEYNSYSFTDNYESSLASPLVSKNTGKLDFGDTIFSTDLDYLKEIELLE